MEFLTPDKETSLLAFVKEGDQKAFKQIFDYYYPLLVSIAYKYTRDAQKAKDLAQDCFVELWKRRESLEITFQLKSYLSRAAANKSLNYIKRKKRIDFNENENLPQPSTQITAQNELESKELEARINAAVEALPERCRIIFCMVRFEEKSHKEIARSLGISTKTIENQMTKALKHLRAELGHLSWLLFCLLNIGW